jgi:hypothetical protein
VAGFYVLRLTGSFSSWRSTWGGVGIGEVRGVEDGHALGQMSVVADTSNELAGAGMNRKVQCSRHTRMFWVNLSQKR